MASGGTTPEYSYSVNGEDKEYNIKSVLRNKLLDKETENNNSLSIKGVLKSEWNYILHL
jgi:hypothetical protein